MGQAISDVLPYAVGVAISPIPLAAVIVMLFTPRARANGGAFLLGWLAGLAVLVTVVYLVADAADVATDTTADDSASTVKIVLGLVLLALALRRWRHRPASGAEPTVPKWMAGLDRVTPVRAAGLGVVLGAVNPKNLALTVAAAARVAQLDPSTRAAVAGLVAFVVVASCLVAVAVGYRLLGGAGAQARLDGAKAWLVEHHDAVMTVLLVVFGVVLLAEGTGRLSR